MNRCGWVTADPLYLAYHDDEWGKPCTDGDKLFEMLCLEGQQAGLSWITILKKRERYRHCFHQFDPVKIAAMNEDDIARLMQDKGIIRNRLKIQAIIANARARLAMEAQNENFSDFIWSFVNHRPVTNFYATQADVPAQTTTSESLSKALKKRGFKFIGPTICYAYMQAVGLVNDHTTDCICHPKQR
ncbi:DNA-3-methyladenine glycosylase I [Lonsdalea quercina]|uniref:DNA-3-methyladenine glycosylase I n=1 Tax=Lonsdalea quercina TaxID=71657 RepID=UPI003976A4E4